MNQKTKKPLPSWLPLLVGGAFVALFAALGAWQLDRGFGKRAERQLFEDETGFTAWQHGLPVRPFQRLAASGAYDGAHQLLLENIIVAGRNGYYVITPLLGAPDEPVLLVNRGWVAPGSLDEAARLPSPAGERVTVRGRAGILPRAAYRMGEAIDASGPWPKRAVYPTFDDVAGALGREVQPFVLLLDEAEADGFERQWAPVGFGPEKHFGYALQWFAMGAALSVLLIWNHRKKRFQ